jgi:cyclopropane fatty-acyl-phospholipid synthase-like methyltransferase
MTKKTDVVQLFTARRGTYDRFIETVRYPQGLRSYFYRSLLLRAGMRILDAGCGTGVVTIALHEALANKGIRSATLHAFDLTPAMLDRFHQKLRERGISKIDTAQADVLQLENLPQDWTEYDLIVSASMLEYIPPQRLPEALRALRDRLADGGRLLVFMTKSNWLTRPLVGWWWQSNVYDKNDLLTAFQKAGFTQVRFRSFPLVASHLATWGHIVEAQKSDRDGASKETGR